jgi:hypothetical protein
MSRREPQEQRRTRPSPTRPGSGSESSHPDSRDPTDDPDSECQRDDPPRGQRSVRAHSSERVAEQPQALHKQDDTGDHPERPRAGQQKHLEKCTDDDSWHGSGQELAGQGGP